MTQATATRLFTTDFSAFEQETRELVRQERAAKQQAGYQIGEFVVRDTVNADGTITSNWCDTTGNTLRQMWRGTELVNSQEIPAQIDSQNFYKPTVDKSFKGQVKGIASHVFDAAASTMTAKLWVSALCALGVGILGIGIFSCTGSITAVSAAAGVTVGSLGLMISPLYLGSAAEKFEKHAGNVSQSLEKVCKVAGTVLGIGIHLLMSVGLAKWTYDMDLAERRENEVVSTQATTISAPQLDARLTIDPLPQKQLSGEFKEANNTSSNASSHQNIAPHRIARVNTLRLQM